MRSPIPSGCHLLLCVIGGFVAGSLPIHAWDGGCPAKPAGLIGGRILDARTTDCQEITSRPLVVRTADFQLGTSVTFLAGGFPGKWDHHIRLVDRATGETHSIHFWSALGEGWVVKTIAAPPGWLGRTVVLEGIDPDLGGAWVGFSRPLSARDLAWLRWAPRLRAMAMTSAFLAVLALTASWAEGKGDSPDV